jgi:amino-acid N-acetyltransferase
MADVEAIHAIITRFAKGGSMLPRSRSELYESLRNFLVCEANGKVVGCGALTITWADLAEVKSLGVMTKYQKSGVGKRMLKALLKEARSIGVKRVFALANKPRFFTSHGFERIGKEELPHKIWADCIKCHKFPDCDEEAVAIDL